MQVEMMPISVIKPYERNPRRNQSAIEKVAASISAFGWQQPIVVDRDFIIIVGHTRYQAALKLGFDSVPVSIATALTPEQVKAYRIADNKVGELAEWDNDLLKLEIDDLKGINFDLDLTGFESKELQKIDLHFNSDCQTDTKPQLDHADVLREQWDVKAGDLWLLGKHLLLCGDSTNAEDVERVMQGENATLCFTSPPYGQQCDYRDGATEKVRNWDSLMEGVFAHLPMSEDGQILVNLGLIHRDNEWLPYWDSWILWMRQQGWRRFGWYVWDQGSGLMGDWAGRFAPAFEFVFHFNKKSINALKTKEKLPESIKIKYGSGTRGKDGELKKITNPESFLCTHKIPDSVIRVNRNADYDIARRNHPATFPIGLPCEFIAAWPGMIYEPFSGSGTTIIACENLQQKCRAIEISPAYVAVALQRYLDHTGIEPKRLD